MADSICDSVGPSAWSGADDVALEVEATRIRFDEFDVELETAETIAR